MGGLVNGLLKTVKQTSQEIRDHFTLESNVSLKRTEISCQNRNS